MTIKDNIPRLQQILPHMRAQLTLLREGATFEAARQQYSSTADTLARQGAGRRAPSRVGDKSPFWTSTAEVLNEGMRLGFVELQQVPSAREYVEAHKDPSYSLTPHGQEMAKLAQGDIAAFCDRLAEALINTHPYFRALLSKLNAAPIVCPEVTEGEVEAPGRDERGLLYWAEYVASRLMNASTGTGIDTCKIKQIIAFTLGRRLCAHAEMSPSGKALAQALNDSFAVVAFHANGLTIGAKDIDIVKCWGTQLRILDQSRFVPGFVGLNVIWPGADFTEEPSVQIHRRGLQIHELAIAKEITESYQRQAVAADSNLSAPYIPIFKVRAEAAYRRRVTRALVDLVIQRMAEADQLLLHLGTTRQPASEPLYRRSGNRRYEMTIQLSH